MLVFGSALGFSCEFCKWTQNFLMGFGSDVGLSLAVGDNEVEDDILQAGDIWSTESSSCRRQQGRDVGDGGVVGVPINMTRLCFLLGRWGMGMRQTRAKESAKENRF